jgi:hypothetical protein
MKMMVACLTNGEIAAQAPVAITGPEACTDVNIFLTLCMVVFSIDRSAVSFINAFAGVFCKGIYRITESFQYD